WHFVPLQDANKNPTRRGLRLEEMSEAQRQAASALLRAGTSADGYVKATTIMSLEAILNDLEKGRIVRKPEWYFFTIFGAPSKTSKWGWRVEGHHLSLNFAIDGGKVIAATPAFFGANPALVKQGPRQGLRTLPQPEDLAWELLQSLSAGQKKVALRDKQFPEVQGQTSMPKRGEPTGLAGGQMTGKQRDLLLKLIQSYADRLPDDVAQTQMSDVQKTGIDRVYFAYAGGAESGAQHSYRVHGPTFLIEFLNVQADSANNPANHIHS